MFNLDLASLAGPGPLADMLLKSVFVFAAAGLVVLIMSRFRASAAARHFVWLTAIAASLVLPLIGLVLPGWSLRLPTPVDQQESVDVSSDIALAFAETSTATLASEELPIAAATATAVPASVAQTVAERPLGPLDPSPSGSTATIDWRSLLIVVWGVGVMVALSPLALGSLSLWRLRRLAQPIAEDRACRLMAQICRQFGIRPRVTLLASDRRQIPMTWGLLRPVVLLPAEATTWSAERLSAVLLHELAHVGRCDCLAQWLAQFSRALYWCNPLAWLAVRQLRHEQEQACDDQVLRSGLLAADYAEHLLAVVARRPRMRFATGVALAMARSARIDRRLRTILDAKRTRNTLSLPRASLVAVAAVSLLVPLATATITFEAQAQEETSRQKDGAEKKAGDEKKSSDRIARLRQMLTDQYVTRPDDERVLEGAIKGIVQSLDDPYSEYLSAEKIAELERQIEGKLTGIGAQLDMRDRQLTVVTPLEGSPAHKAGVRAGDAILEIDGKPTGELSLPDAVKRILGEAGSKISLKVRRAKGDTAELTIERGPIVLRTVSGLVRGKDHRWQYLIDREHKIAYIAVSQLGPRTADEIKEAVSALKEDGLKGLILDLRFSPGGLLQSAVDVAGLFLGEATVVTARGRDGKEQAWKSDGKNQLGDFPLVVLAGERTASATEVLTGALRDNGRAIVVGARTWGKGSIQSLIKLDEGTGAVRLTTAYFYSPSGRTIERKPGEKVWGVDPTDGYFVPMTQEATERLIELRKTREIIGDASADAAPAEPLNAEAIAKQGDAQLAAALRTLAAKVTSGEFEKVGQSAAAAQEYAQRRRELEDRRAALTKSLEELDRQWKSLDQPK
jgi:carboxyl-terminal processing protease